MTPAKLDAKLQGQSAIARKVYDAVPIQAAWSVPQIVGAVRRATGGSVDHRTVVGCLIALKSGGVVGESQPGLFKRVEVKGMTVVGKAAQEYESVVKAVGSVPSFVGLKNAPRPIDVIAQITVGLTAVCEQLRKLVTNLEDAALLIEGSMAEQDANLGKLRQLQTLLKSLSLA
ncbi:hypothetical protein [Cupriavidus numazuensis]|uniref:KfrA N-terminal DNA-binding domain-containing protein n=1 Tax=Cupriavidus numazuensis TaxID=221992 RepID=A0ABM8T9H2_9BURK|nr:hypothetical protein [Cupriavidus numazuensis]CAG2129206.1 hypothetical protein LMG26411_00137 [Cupriavidus numazuensis]